MEGLAGFRSYYRRFWKRFFKDGFSWGRDNVVFGFLIAVAILAAQVYFGKLRPADGASEIWALFVPYGVTFFVWACYQCAVTAWKLDHDRDIREGPLLYTEAKFSSSGVLELGLDNEGEQDEEYFAEISTVYGTTLHPTLPIPVRWKGHGDARSVTLNPHQTEFMELADVPDCQPSEGESVATKVVLLGAGVQHETRIACRAPGKPAELTICLVIRSARERGRLKSLWLHVRVDRDGSKLSRAVYRSPVYGTRG